MASENIAAAKLKLRQAIERKIFEFNDRKVKEQVIDFTVMYLRRNNIPHNSDELAKVLEVFRLAIDDAYYKNIDGLMVLLDNDINALAEAIDPLDPTSSSSDKKKVLAETVRVKESGKASKTTKSR